MPKKLLKALLSIVLSTTNIAKHRLHVWSRVSPRLETGGQDQGTMDTASLLALIRNVGPDVLSLPCSPCTLLLQCNVNDDCSVCCEKVLKVSTLEKVATYRLVYVFTLCVMMINLS